MHYIDYGLSVVSADIFKNYDQNSYIDLSDIYEELSKYNKIKALEVFERFYEIGTPTSLLETEGYFLKLTPDQKKILTSKAIESMRNKDNSGKINYNLLFIESSEKLKRTYFESLNSLIQILEKMKETPIINNKTLNLISKETKGYIDNMYNLCYYYYIYGIISLIFSEIIEEIPKENSVGKFITNSIKNKK